MTVLLATSLLLAASSVAVNLALSGVFFAVGVITAIVAGGRYRVRASVEIERKDGSGDRRA